MIGLSQSTIAGEKKSPKELELPSASESNGIS